MKKYFFILAVVLLGQLACGSSDDLSSDQDAGSDALPTRSDALGHSDQVRAPGCEVPAPAVKSMWGSAVTTTPRGGYRTLEGFATCSVAQYPAPRACSRPVDGFSDGSSWCCVSTVKGADGLYRPARATVQCFGGSMLIVPTKAPGNVALCSAEGKFVGWDCMDDLIGQ